MPNPKAISLSDALAEVTAGKSSGTQSLDDALKSVAGSRQSPQSDSGALLGAAAAKAEPIAADAALGFATSPTAAKTVGAIARAGTTTAGVVHGVATGNVPEVIASPIAGWQAGKGGYFLGKGMQAVAAPIAEALTKAKPFMQAVSTLSAAQGVNDLAQMAEPNRTDIGVLGIGKSQPHDADHPAIINAIVDDAVKKLSAIPNMTKGQIISHLVRFTMGLP